MACPVPKYHRRGMVRRRERLRCVLPNTWNFCTSRTRRAEYSFSELGEGDRAVLTGYIIAAARMYRVELAFFFVMSNHIHLICRAAIPEAISLFHAHFKAQFARYINRKYGRSGSVWGGRFHNINLLDDEAQIRALIYGIDHGMKESLVERSDEWHLPHTVKEMCGDGWLRGNVWRRRVGAVEGAWRRNKLRLVPLDRWSDDPVGFRAYVRALLEARVQHYVEQRAAEREAFALAVSKARAAGLGPARIGLPTGRLRGIIRQHDFVPARAKASQRTRFKAWGPEGNEKAAAARQAHRDACEAYERTMRALVRGTLDGPPRLPAGYQWPTSVAATLGVGVVGRTWAEVFAETTAMPPGSAWACAG